MTIWTPQLGDKGPRYRRIADAIMAAIQSGELAAGERLPPQRRLADQLGVTIGTISRAYAEAHQQGWVESRVGSGTYVRHRDDEATTRFRATRMVNDGMIDMSMSFPPPHSLRATGLHNALTRLCASADAMQAATDYQHEAGTPEQRDCMAAWQGRLGLPDDPQRLLITQGGQHGIHLVLRTLVQPGELVAADALTYPGFVCAARQAHLRQLAVPLDEQGMDVEALARLCARQPPRLLYCMPDLNNPTGARLSESRRHRLVEIAREHDIWLVEDAVQYLPPHQRGTALIELAPERTLHIFSTSKVLAGGLRIGTLSVPAQLQERLCAALRSQSWMVPPLMVQAACHWMEDPAGQSLLDWQIDELAARRALALEHLAAYQPRSQPGSSLVWLPLPEGQRSSQVQAALKQSGVLVSTAEPFCMGSEPVPQALRLCLGPPASRELLLHGLETIVATLAKPPEANWATV
ncbi:PLP-dependent aminotransferase family protein [Halomonas sp. 18H]|uniref:aminotransferase-like domain-containing protein n=1 Tax=Halomonas almeriensis TaxID=308163 RepID=UPI00222E08C0|nr:MULTISPECIES: PLP-dependent aminotransferase family protein [Halomonas]MCW4151199.1 PLP-dependent aminotransferase family protein [Halomonas sp. 18H]MDN3553079.1 PLP-dependent aminotransferase family protein [Halomonas almeriensis]